MATGQPHNERRYDTSGRRARAEESRRHVVALAHDLFTANGYARTTVADVARAAQVSQPTVYAAFGSKAGLLRRCIEVALAGDDDQQPVADRPLAQWVYDTDDALDLLGRYSFMMATLGRRAGPIYDVLARAADSDQELTELRAEFERQRLRAAGMVADALAARGGLAPGLSTTEARDTIWVLNAPELYVTLTATRRWSQRHYQRWVRDALIKLLMRPTEPGQLPSASER